MIITSSLALYNSMMQSNYIPAVYRKVCNSDQTVFLPLLQAVWHMRLATFRASDNNKFLIALVNTPY